MNIEYKPKWNRKIIVDQEESNNDLQKKFLSEYSRQIASSFVLWFPFKIVMQNPRLKYAIEPLPWQNLFPVGGSILILSWKIQ